MNYKNREGEIPLYNILRRNKIMNIEQIREKFKGADVTVYKKLRKMLMVNT